MANLSLCNLAVWACAFSLGACAGQVRRAGPTEVVARPVQAASANGPSAMSAPRAASAPAETRPAVQSSAPPDVTRRFQAHLAEQRDLEVADLERQLSLARPPDRPLSFNPEAARFASAAIDKLALSPEERSAFKKDGVVNVDHQQRYSMGAAYYAIFTRDLPVLVTTDSILHALHRSYDAILQNLETTEFTSTLRTTLEKSHESLRKANLAKPKLKASYQDVDLYLTVARNLLEAKSGDALAVPSLLGSDARVKLTLAKIASLKLEFPPEHSDIYGGQRAIDYSQFKPRGHYTASPELSRYFQTLIWLGRADTGFVLAPPDKNAGLVADDERELRSAALLALAVDNSGERARFEAMAQTIDFLVGRADNLTIGQLLGALGDAGISNPSALEQTGSVVAVQQKVALLGRQQIRGQTLAPPRNAEREAQSPSLFQLFGQRFMIDSYALSRLVYDSIEFKGHKQERQMPMGLDVMAALGNDEATRLLRPELERYHYASNLLAVRRTIEDRRPEDIEQSVASLWLDSLRKLDDVPGRGNFPEAMKRTPFARKQLQTQLASWAELRHDTVLYAKQSYTAGIMCQYPEGYVEPYPEFFARLALLTSRAKQRFEAMGQTQAYADFFGDFSDTMRYLEILARKELEAKPFTAAESGFLKKTIDASGMGCGPPRYDGWYVRLFYGGGAEVWKPTVTDVHTDPTSSTVLQAGVGDANFMLLAVDNQKDRAVYVGPVYSYYEFVRGASDRMTDEQWSAAIAAGTLPARPAWWTSAFPAKSALRTLTSARTTPKETDPRALAADRLTQRAGATKGQEMWRLTREAQAQRAAARKPPLAVESSQP
jgi:Protein of unknown function (DUF3160)